MRNARVYEGHLPYGLAKATGCCQVCEVGGAQVVGARYPVPGAEWWLGVVCAECLDAVREDGAVVVVLVAGDDQPAPLLGDVA